MTSQKSLTTIIKKVKKFIHNIKQDRHLKDKHGLYQSKLILCSELFKKDWKIKLIKIKLINHLAVYGNIWTF